MSVIESFEREDQARAQRVRMAFDEANAAGGVNGRKIKFVAEDMQY